MQSMVSCRRPGGTLVLLPVLGARGRKLVGAGWQVEARDDGAIYTIRLISAEDGSVAYGAKGETWAAAWELLEQSIPWLDPEHP